MASVAVGMLGHGEGKQRSEGGREPESEREAERCVASPGRRRGSGSKQEVARACRRAAATRALSFWRAEEDDWQGGLGWAAQKLGRLQ